MSPAREIEANLVEALTQAARSGRPPESHHEAELFRFAAQLLKTWHPEEAGALDAAALQHFAHCGVKPKSFPQIAADGKIGDVARFRRAMENSLAGIVTW